MATDLLTALTQVKKSSALAKKFSTEPETVLKSLGVNTSKLQISKGFKRTAKPPVVFQPAGGTSLTVCGSIGFVVCASVGGEV